MDFGDTCSSLVIRIVQEKFLSQLCKLELTKHLILNCAYADDYSRSFKDKKMYQQVKNDMIEVHNTIDKKKGAHLSSHISAQHGNQQK